MTHVNFTQTNAAPTVKPPVPPQAMVPTHMRTRKDGRPPQREVVRMAYPGEEGRLAYLRYFIKVKFIWADGRPIRKRGKIVDELIHLEGERIWNEALDHLWALNDPANTVVQTRSRKPILTQIDVEQARAENPYAKPFKY